MNKTNQTRVRSNIVECYKSNDSFDRVERCFDIVAGVDGAQHCMLYRVSRLIIDKNLSVEWRYDTIRYDTIR